MADLIFQLIEKEEQRQGAVLEMIPSENYAFPEVLQALGSCLTNKYAEGYPGKRYYQGNEIIDEIENLAIERVKNLFGTPHANVQPYSGSPANQAVYMAVCNVGDKVMGMDLSAGGHLTHGSPVNFSGRNYRVIFYGVDEKTEKIDYEEVRRLAEREKPKLIWAGATAYPRIFDWKKFAEIADSVGAFFASDIAHYAGLVAGGAYPSPAPYADLITFTTHKTLRGPRGAVILVTDKGKQKDKELIRKVDKAVFPGLQGGPHENVIAAMAICFEKAKKVEFKQYCQQVVNNARVLAEELKRNGFDLVSDGTDNHLILMDLRNKNVDGKDAAVALENAGIVVNANTIPFDPNPPLRPSGLRLGTPAITVRGMKEKEMMKIAGLINEAVSAGQDQKEILTVREKVLQLTSQFPL